MFSVPVYTVTYSLSAVLLPLALPISPPSSYDVAEERRCFAGTAHYLLHATPTTFICILLLCNCFVFYSVCKHFCQRPHVRVKMLKFCPHAWLLSRSLELQRTVKSVYGQITTTLCSHFSPLHVSFRHSPAYCFLLTKSQAILKSAYTSRAPPLCSNSFSSNYLMHVSLIPEINTYSTQ
jgi:hypothetical protein